MLQDTVLQLIELWCRSMAWAIIAGSLLQMELHSLWSLPELVQLLNHIIDPDIIFYGEHSGVIGCAKDKLYQIYTDDELSGCYDKETKRIMGFSYQHLDDSHISSLKRPNHVLLWRTFRALICLGYCSCCNFYGNERHQFIVAKRNAVWNGEKGQFRGIDDLAPSSMCPP